MGARNRRSSPHESPMSDAASARHSGDASVAWSAAALADLESLSVAQGAVVRRQEPLSRHTSMGVGGPTPLMLWPRHPQAVGALLEWCAGRALPWRVLGGGTNVLVPDTGVGEPVLNISRLTDGIRLQAPRGRLPAGLPTAQALRLACRKGLGGLVWSTGLPGTIGGAAAGNAGCWGGEMAGVVSRLDLVAADGSWRSLPAAALRWSYRRLELPEDAGIGAVIVAVEVELRPEEPAELASRCEQLQRRKRESQPVGARNAGCIFKNPAPDSAAGLLIDRAGCKGMRVGDAEISQLHGNFLINHGDASSADVEALIAAVKDSVREHAGVTLVEEIRRW